MRIDARRRMVLAATLALAAMPVPALAQSRVWLAGINYESPALFAPVLVVHAAGDSGREWNLWLTGWTVGADLLVPRGARRRWHAIARATPVNAHASNYIYQDGRRDAFASYSAASFELAGGLDVRQTPRWTGSYRLAALYERVGKTQTDAIRRAWSQPFVGMQTFQSYSRVRSASLLESRWDGIKAETTAEIYTGDRTWTRVSGAAGAGTRRGPIFVSGRAAAFTGGSLNSVSAFLVGGSWELASADMLAGFRYGEFRVRRGGTLRGGVDVRLRGAWEVGIRAAFLRAPALTRRGAAIQLMTVCKGAFLQGGVALPGGTGGLRRAVVFASLSAALVQR